MITVSEKESDCDQNEICGIDRMLEILIAGLVGISIFGLLMAAIGIFRAPQALLLGVGFAIGYSLLTKSTYKATGKFKVGKITLHLVLIIIVGLFFRLPIVNYVSGGQDQGVYVNMASHIVRSGGFAIQDNVLKKVDGENNIAKYSSDNHPKTTDFLLGLFYKGSPSSGNLEFQFYHLFPVWMAIFGGILGLNKLVWALTFLSILSLIFFYRLALGITRRPGLALLAGMLLALNPLHAFFSRFPVTELPTLCFTLSGFWLALYSWQESTILRSRWKICLSVLAFGCAFLTRVTGFMYMPTFILVGLIACVFESRPVHRKGVMAWVTAVLVIYACTVIYGLAFSNIYVEAMYSISFEPLLGRHWQAFIYIISASLFLFLGLIYYYSDNLSKSVTLKNALNACKTSIGVIIVAILAVWMVKTYAVGFTQKYLSDPTLNERFHIVGLGMGVLKYSSLVVAAEYLGPFILPTFCILVWIRRFNAPITVLLAFVTCFFAYICILQWVIPYQPYYARYLVSEFVPYLLLFVVAASAYVTKGYARRSLQFVFAMTLVYCGILSIGQLRAHAQEGMAASYARIAKHVGDQDLLLLDTSSLYLPDQLIEMPFMLRYGKNVARITQSNVDDPTYLNSLQRHYDNMFLLSGSPVAPKGFQMVSSVRLRELVADQGHKPTLSTAVRFNERTFLYVRRGPSIVPNRAVDLNSHTIGQSAGGWRKMLVSGWSRPESWGVWSSGSHARLYIPAHVNHGGSPLSLILHVRGFLTDSHRRQRVNVTVNGTDVLDTTLDYPESGDVKLVIPLRAGVSQSDGYNIEFTFPDATSPAALGTGGDTRMLAIGLVSANLLSE